MTTDIKTIQRDQIRTMKKDIKQLKEHGFLFLKERQKSKMKDVSATPEQKVEPRKIVEPPPNIPLAKNEVNSKLYDIPAPKSPQETQEKILAKEIKEEMPNQPPLNIQAQLSEEAPPMEQKTAKEFGGDRYREALLPKEAFEKEIKEYLNHPPATKDQNKKSFMEDVEEWVKLHLKNTKNN